MKEWCEEAKATLAWVSQKDWPPAFVALRMEFFRKFSGGLICSTSHGIDFFDNVLGHISGERPYSKKVEGGEYGDNFRKIVEGRKMA